MSTLKQVAESDAVAGYVGGMVTTRSMVAVAAAGAAGAKGSRNLKSKAGMASVPFIKQ